MATSGNDESKNLDKLNANIARIDALTQRLISAFARKQPPRTDLQGPDPSLYMRAATAYWSEMINNPSKILEHQVGYWGKTLKHFVEAQEVLRKGQLAPPEDHTPDDRRFSNPLWKTHPWFNFVKQQYLMSSQAIEEAIASLDTLDPQEKKRLEYFGKQIIDLMAPTNFLATNPDALERAVETDGESLVKGMENLVRDLEANDGELLVTLADKEAFKVGGNIATTEGAVVFRNRMFELIQYKPTTEKVHETPLLIFPPWINKFYILDLKPQNSLIKWIVDQGYTLFVVSWVNPDASYRDVGMDDLCRGGVPDRDREGQGDLRRQDDQHDRLLHRRHHAGPDAGADEQAPQPGGEIGDLLHHADRFFRSGRGGRVPVERFHRRAGSRGRREGLPASLLHVAHLPTCARTT
jgi:polyhydroxyalkanoate synthase subunit PhaC